MLDKRVTLSTSLKKPMKKTKKVSEFYESLEKFESLNIWNIQRELSATERIKSKKWENKILTERKALTFNINKGELEQNTQVTNINGKVNDFKIFNNEEIEYLKSRIEETNNTWLKSRYAHIIWNETKHNDFAIITVDNYILTINKIKKKEEIRELFILVSAILYISKSVKSTLEKAKTVTFELLNTLPEWLKPNILSEILENNIFKKKELETIADNFIHWIDNKNPSSYFSNKHSLELGIKLFEKIQRKNSRLYELLAENEQIILDEHPNDKDFVKITTLGRIASYYQKAGNKIKSTEVLKQYNDIKQRVELKNIKVELDSKHTEMFTKYLELKSEAILNQPTESILAFFSNSEDILVDPIENKKRAKEGMKNSLHQLFTTSVFDINSNFKQLSDSEKFDKEIIQSYKLGYSLYTYSIFIKVFVDGVITGKLNYYKIVQYLVDYTWFNNKFKRKLALHKTDEETTWITFLAPSIQNLFAQFELSILLNTNKINNYILCIDSLTLKFEGAIRDFILLCGGNTTRDKNGLLQEQLLDELLGNEIILDKFSDRDIELFKYAFSKNGKDLRNSVAHSFMRFSDYSLQNALLVFLCFLRLGKYAFEKKTLDNNL